MNSTMRVLLILLVVLLAADQREARAQRELYWSDLASRMIHRASVEGGAVEDVLYDFWLHGGLALDLADGKVYWTVFSDHTLVIRRADLDGSNVEDLVTRTGPSVGSSGALALDLSARKMYWEDTWRIRRADLDGSRMEVLTPFERGTGTSLALDPQHGYMYWVNRDWRRIERARLDGSQIEFLVTEGLSRPTEIALDVPAGKMYWMDTGTNKIQRANLDGSSVEDVVEYDLAETRGFALDPRDWRIYWGDPRFDRIMRAYMDGSAIEPFIVTSAQTPVALAVTCGGPDCQPNGIPDDCEVASVDCNGNGVPDDCDAAYGPSQDCTGNGIPDECEPDCNGNGVADSCDTLDGTSADCSGNEIPDECEPDCNGNGIADSCDVLSGLSDDCTGNEIPDECEPDCNGNGIADSCDIAGGTSQDCTNDSIPDECEPDCNANGAADSCDLAEGIAEDCDGDGILDECELTAGAADCNANGIPDECDIAMGLSSDYGQNGIPDDCEPPLLQLRPVRASGTEGVDWELGPGFREITLTSGGQSIEFDMLISGWDGNGMQGYYVALDCSSFDSGQQGTLLPPLLLCDDAAPGDFCQGIDTDRPDQVMYGTTQISLCDVDTLCADGSPGKIRCGSTILFGTMPDGGGVYYAATFAATLSSDAKGAFTFALDPDPDHTFITMSDTSDVSPALAPATVIVITGSCCRAAGVPLGCVDGVTIAECDALGGTFTSGAVCSGIDETGDFATGGPDGLDDACPLCTQDSHCDDGLACTTDVCVAESCVFTDLCDDGNACSVDTCTAGGCEFDTTITHGFCCNPATGESTEIDDGDPCTVDLCDHTTGSVTHERICNPVPTVSTWGVACLALVLLIAGKLALRRRERTREF